MTEPRQNLSELTPLRCRRWRKSRCPPYLPFSSQHLGAPAGRPGPAGVSSPLVVLYLAAAVIVPVAYYQKSCSDQSHRCLIVAVGHVALEFSHPSTGHRHPSASAARTAIAFRNAHHDERGFASMHIYHVGSGTPVAAILRPARTSKGSEVRTVIRHVTKRLRRHWPNSASCGAATATSAAEAMDWAEDNDLDTFSASPAMPRSMPWWRRRLSICVSIMR